MNDDEIELNQPLLPWLSLVVGAFLVAWVSRPWSPPSLLPKESVMALGGCFLLAEVVAPRLAGLGRFPLSWPALVILLVTPGMGTAAGIFALLAALIVRLLRRHGRGEPWLALASDYLPELAAFLAFQWGNAILAVLAFALTWQALPGLFLQSLSPEVMAYWSLARERSLALMAFFSLCGLALAQVFVTQPVPCLVILAGMSLLTLPVDAQLRVLKTEAEARQQHLQARSQARASQHLAQLRQQVDMQRLDVELQQRILALVGELFVETASISNASELRPALLRFLRRVVPGARLGLYESEPGRLICTASLGQEELAPPSEGLWKVGVERSQSISWEDSSGHHLGASIPERGLLVISDRSGRWEEEHRVLLARMAFHMPLCLDAVRYRESQSRALSSEQARRQEADWLAARLTSSLDLISQLVACHELEELISTTQRKLPELIPPYEVEIHWRDKIYEPPINSPQSQTQYNFSLSDGKGSLLLTSASDARISALDMELLRLFSSQFSSLLEGAELNHTLRVTLEQLKNSQAQLVQSSKLAAIGQLAAGVAHELNTPLGAISISIELAVDNLRREPERASKRLEKALESVEQMQGIIAKLLSYSRDSRGLHSEVDLNQVLESSYQLVAHTMMLAGVEVEILPGPELPLVGNANELQQVFSNLLLNAKDACLHPQARRKRIEAWLEGSAQQAKVHVRDYGCGMDEVTQERIFDPFYTTKSVGEGTGLGLSTSLELVEQHGGKISVKSALGEGTHFVVSLPLEAES